MNLKSYKKKIANFMKFLSINYKKFTNKVGNKKKNRNKKQMKSSENLKNVVGTFSFQ